MRLLQATSYQSYEQYQALLAAPTYGAGIASLDTVTPDPLAGINLVKRTFRATLQGKHDAQWSS